MRPLEGMQVLDLSWLGPGCVTTWLLADLGFLNIFVGGGFRADIGQSAGMQAIVYYFSDVPEWSALLANIRNWWRSYPWLAWYPGVAFFLAILAFNLLGEGLRRFLEESRVNIGRVRGRIDGRDPARVRALLADSLTYSFLLLLDELSPVERAVLLLHDVFGYPFEQVAGMVDRSVPAVRQIASRTRRRMADARPGWDPDRSPSPATRRPWSGAPRRRSSASTSAPANCSMTWWPACPPASRSPCRCRST